MSSSAEILLKLKIAQLEGKLLLYESLASELSRIESVQQVASNAKFQMEEILEVWDEYRVSGNET
jgi:hypothetical protein